MCTAKSLTLGTPRPLECEQYSKLGETFGSLFQDRLEPSTLHQKIGDLFFKKNILGDRAVGSGRQSTAGCWEGWGPALLLKTVFRILEVKAVPPGGILRDFLLENLTQVWQTNLKATKWNLRWATARIPQKKKKAWARLPYREALTSSSAVKLWHFFFFLYSVCNSLPGFWGKAPIIMLGIKIYQKKVNLELVSI